MTSSSDAAGDHTPRMPEMAQTHARRPSIEELDNLELADWGHLTGAKRPKVSTTYSGPPSPQSMKDEGDCTGWNSAVTPNELEANQPPTPTRDDAVCALPSFRYPRMNKWRVLCACLIYFGNGMSDSAPGALIPYIEDYYHIGYATVSMMWIANAFGFILSAFVTDLILTRFGRARTLMIAETFMIGAYIVIACAPPFPVVAVAYFFMGLGNATNVALNNVFCANLADSTVILGLAHGSYGIGGIVAPIAATAMVSNGIFWARFYLVTIGIRVCCFFFAAWSFWSYDSEPTSKFASDLQHIAEKQAAVEQKEPSKLNLLKTALQCRTTIIGALFIFAYQGAEVSTSGWFISYLINYRHGDPAKVGYVTSGFWAGITIGRFTLTHLAHRIGEKRFVFVLGIGSIVFQLLSWLIPSIIGNAVSVAILGLLLGPVYPAAATVFTRLLPRRMQTVAIGLISSAGSSGGAMVPFLTGLAAQSKGTFILHPICIGAYVMMLICWVTLPRVKKPTH
ncbi:Putative major facilitator superfamily, MFS transporter superfamily [Septoria linicola]|uniref:Major facilitator superfamily, MFS transporter superfamily n=1 Tax=Septoria linicola TaxID=215465 RepID=A0A9Q9AW44_9PEZI|nr:Putative major facilitator superfamily, MFS transporter superfamily [Septoria linicola]